MRVKTLDKFFSISDAARYLGVFSLTLRNWEKKGFIKAFRTPGGHRRFKKTDLDKIIGSGARKDRLKENIAGLEEIECKDGHQKKLSKLIENLKNISDEL